jgi:thymidylate synthase
MKNMEHDYLKLMYDVFKNGELKQGRNGKTRSVFGRQIRHDMKLGFPLLTTKKMYWKGIVTELLWFLRGDTNIKFLVDNGCHIWDGDAYKRYVDSDEVRWPKSKEDFIECIKTDHEFAKKWGDLGPIYGAQWRKWDGIDQIQELINTLKTNPDSRRMLVSAWNVNYLDEMVLPPCHYGFQVYTRELSLKERRNWCKNNNVVLEHLEAGLENEEDDMRACGVPTRAISLMWSQRSADVFLGLPFNIASYGLLLEIIAKAVNMVPDELIGNIGDAHLYLNHIEQAKEQMHRELYPLPKLMFKDHLKDFVSIIDILRINDFILDGYESHPAIKAPLSN